MYRTRMKHALSCILCVVLLAAAALNMTGCSNSQTQPSASQTQLYTSADAPHSLGKGQTTFLFTVTDLAGDEVTFEISTDETTVGAALAALGLIQGEEGPYGLMVTHVNGVKLDYDADKAYWGFFIDGEYAMSGVDQTEIQSGKAYAFRATKA